MYLENMNYNSATNFPFVLDLHMFDANPNTNVTTQSTLSAEMKTFYDRNVIFRRMAVRKSSSESMYSSANPLLR